MSPGQLEALKRWKANVQPEAPGDTAWIDPDDASWNDGEWLVLLDADSTEEDLAAAKKDPPDLVFSVDRRTGDLVDVRVDPVWLARRRPGTSTPAIHVPPRRENREPRPRERRTRRAGASRDGPRKPEDPEPPPVAAPLSGGAA